MQAKGNRLMLGTLQHIVQQVNEAANVDEALAIIVYRVKEAVAADVCSVYIKNVTTGHYVLMASDGLNPKSLGTVELAPNEGPCARWSPSRDVPVNP